MAYETWRHSPWPLSRKDSGPLNRLDPYKSTPQLVTVMLALAAVMASTEANSEISAHMLAALIVAVASVFATAKTPPGDWPDEAD